MNAESIDELGRNFRHSAHAADLENEIDKLTRALACSKVLYVSCSRQSRTLQDAAWEVLQTNGGPIDAESTIDGKEYVMVELRAFNALEAALSGLSDANSL